MPSADSRYTLGAPYGLLTRTSVAVAPFGFVFLSPLGGGRLTVSQAATFRRCRGFDKPVIPNIRQLLATVRSRCSGPPGVNTCTFRTRSPSIRAWPIVDRGLCPVLRTRPTRPASLDFCSSPHAFAVPCLSRATAFPCTVTDTWL